MKLVRNKIPNIIYSTGKTPVYYEAKKPEYESRLLDKMIEELEEFRENPCLEEAADMWEVLETIYTQWGWKPDEVVAVALHKKKIRGGFDHVIVLVEVKNENE